MITIVGALLFPGFRATFLSVGGAEIIEEEFEGDTRAGRTDISRAAAPDVAKTGGSALGDERDSWFVGDGVIDDPAVHDGGEDRAVGLHGGHDGKAVLIGQERPDGVE